MIYFKERMTVVFSSIRSQKPEKKCRRRWDTAWLFVFFLLFLLPHFSPIACSQFFSLCHNLSCLNYFAELIRNFFAISKRSTELFHYFAMSCCPHLLPISTREIRFFFRSFLSLFLSAVPNLNFWHLYESNDLIFNWTQILALLSTALQQTEIHFSTKTIFYVTLYTYLLSTPFQCYLHNPLTHIFALRHFEKKRHRRRKRRNAWLILALSLPSWLEGFDIFDVVFRVPQTFI